MQLSVLPIQRNLGGSACLVFAAAGPQRGQREAYNKGGAASHIPHPSELPIRAWHYENRHPDNHENWDHVL
jgi:hypothetical protein